LSIYVPIGRFCGIGKDAKTLAKTKYDKGSTNLAGYAYLSSLGAIFLGAFLAYRKVSSFDNAWTGWIGAIMAVSGFIIRLFAWFDLGRFYTRTIRITDHHEIVRTGLYKSIRHPGYLGVLLIFMGTALAVSNWISLIYVWLVLPSAVFFRIQAEETMLIDHFGEDYRAYMKTTRPLTPRLWKHAGKGIRERYPSSIHPVSNTMRYDMGSAKGRLLALRMSARTLQRALRLYFQNGSSRAWQQLVSFIYRKVRGTPVPTTAFVVITYRCQLQCPHCYSAVEIRGSGDEMSTEEVKSVLGEIRALGTLQVVFTGGEPLLRKDVFELVTYAHSLGLITRLNSNGVLLTAECVAALKRAGLNKCGVSIDHADPDIHDRLRGSPGAFEKALRALGHLRRYNIERQLLAYSSHDKLSSELERIAELGKNLRVSSVFFTIPYLSGRWRGSQDEAFSEGDMARLRGLLRHPLVAMEFPRAGKKCAACAQAIIHVSAQGGVTTCPAVPFLLGNIRREPLAQIWRRLTSTRPLEFKGRCPLNNERDRQLLKAHAATVVRPPFPS
jgi:MoaA/NifB/PqqE/SkfB family radical SAM enzyme/protein-S-isoprenylcysteine O-methyltransferase Ste14